MGYNLLDRSVLAAAFAQLPVLSSRYPLFRLFGISEPVPGQPVTGLTFRHVEKGATIKVSVYQPAEQLLAVVDATAPSHQVQRGTVGQIEAEPAFARGHHVLTVEEAELKDQPASPENTDGWAALRTLLGSELRQDALETLHYFCAQALLGTGSFTRDGIVQALSYGLTAIARPSNKWSDATNADPIGDLYAAKKTFAATAGEKPDSIIYHPDAAAWIRGATKTKSEIRYVEDLQRAALRGETVPLAGIRNWIEVDGRFANADRWNPNVVVMASLGDLTSGVYQDGVPTCGFHTARLEENEWRGGAGVWVSEKDDPMTRKVIASINGIAIIHKRTHVQTWEVNW